MFYSHEILTSRKYGVATVWLVATLGSKSALKKVDRKAIVNVNVPKACEVIITPEAPLALRLQSNLLCGVSRVYLQQCGYVLTDAQTLHNSMKHLLRNIKSDGHDLDSSTAKTRPDALQLQDDPTFLPELALDSLTIDFCLNDFDFDLAGSSSQLSSILSGSRSRSSHTSIDSEPRIIIPSSEKGDLGAVGELSGFGFNTDRTSQSGRLSQLGRTALNRFHEDDGFLAEPDFGFDEEGNLYETTNLQDSAAQAGTPGTTNIEEHVISGDHRLHGLKRNPPQPFDAVEDMGPMLFMEDDQQLPDAEPFPTRDTLQQGKESDNIMLEQNGAEGDADLSSDYATTAKQQRRRGPKKLKPLRSDTVQDIRSSEMRSWVTNYINNMQAAIKAKKHERLKALSKKNAEFYVWGQGIARLGRDYGTLGVQHPLDVFWGEKLKDAVLGISKDIGQKRNRNEVDDEAGSQDSSRRVRARGSHEIGRAEHEPYNMAADDEAMGGMMDDEEPEIGRTAPTPIEDEGSTLMPWNISAIASQRSSYLTGRKRPFSRAGSVSSQLQLQQQQRRLTSASPLIGRGLVMAPHESRHAILVSAGGVGRLPSISAPDIPGLAGLGDEDQIDASQFNAANADDELDSDLEYETYGPAARVSTQTAQEASWVRQALDTEAQNFRTFVESAISARTQDLSPSELLVQQQTIDFEDLLSPLQNSRIVAAQALLHCITLATKNLMVLKQHMHFGAISIGLWSSGYFQTESVQGYQDDTDEPTEDEDEDEGMSDV